MAHATEDDVASLRNAQWVLDGVSGPTEFLPMHESYHMLTLDRQRRLLTERTVEFFQRLAQPEAAPRASVDAPYRYEALA